MSRFQRRSPYQKLNYFGGALASRYGKAQAQMFGEQLGQVVRRASRQELIRSDPNIGVILLCSVPSARVQARTAMFLSRLRKLRGQDADQGTGRIFGDGASGGKSRRRGPLRSCQAKLASNRQGISGTGSREAQAIARADAGLLTHWDSLLLTETYESMQS